MKTDLQKILSVSGESGLFLYLSQGKNGIIAESLVTKKRTAFGVSAKVTTLSDISIYTEDAEVPLRELFLKMKEHLAGAAAIDHRSDSKMLVKFFEEVLPTYDREKFYTSHMKKVLQWYTILKDHATLDFVDHEQEAADAEAEANSQEGGEKTTPKAKGASKSVSGSSIAGKQGKGKQAPGAKQAPKPAMLKNNAAPKKVASVAKKGA